MSEPISYARLKFDASGTPESERHGDVYFTRGQGIAESTYVFLQQNDFPTRWQRAQAQGHWVIAETGFGTSLNFLLTAKAFLQHAGANSSLQFISFEKFPLSPEDFAATVAQWPELQCGDNASAITGIITALIEKYPMPLPGFHRLQLHPRITLDLYLGDVLEGLPEWAQTQGAKVDAWYLDGFAPSKNPDMWQPELYRAIAHTLKANGTMATFTATGAVRRGLTAAGLRVKKVAGFANKREMLVGRRQHTEVPANLLQHHGSTQSIHIIGGGIAAACLLTELRDFPGTVVLHNAGDDFANGASGNPQAAVYPPLQAQWNRFSAFYGHAFLYAKSFYQQHTELGLQSCGVELQAATTTDRERLQKVAAVPHYPHELVQWHENGLHIPQAGWVAPATTVKQIVASALSYRNKKGLTTQIHHQQSITGLQKEGTQWLLYSANGTYTASQVVLCSGYQGVAVYENDHENNNTRQDSHELARVRPVRGQITVVRAKPDHNITHVLCQKGYVLPPLQGRLCTGATFDKTSCSEATTEADNRANLEQLEALLHIHYQQDDIVTARASVRATTPDHLPLVGPALRTATGAHWQGLWLLSGLGSRGFTSAPICAATLAAQILGKPMALSSDLIKALQPSRFARREQKRGGKR